MHVVFHYKFVIVSLEQLQTGNDMRVDLLDCSLNDFSEEECALISQAQKALASVTKRVKEHKNGPKIIGDNYLYETQVIGAVIFSKPISIDFRAFRVGEIGQAFLGPQVPLTSSLFNDDKLPDSFMEELNSSWEEYINYLIEEIEQA